MFVGAAVLTCLTANTILSLSPLSIAFFLQCFYETSLGNIPPFLFLFLFLFLWLSFVSFLHTILIQYNPNSISYPSPGQPSGFCSVTSFVLIKNAYLDSWRAYCSLSDLPATILAASIPSHLNSGHLYLGTVSMHLITVQLSFWWHFKCNEYGLTISPCQISG